MRLDTSTIQTFIKKQETRTRAYSQIFIRAMVCPILNKILEQKIKRDIYTPEFPFFSDNFSWNYQEKADLRSMQKWQ